MSQYSLSYDSSGNSSLTATTTPTRTTIPSGDWKVSDYISRTQDYGVTETYNKNSPEEQLKAITKILVPSGNDNKDDRDNKDIKKDFSPEFNWKDYTYMEMSKALGIDAADDWVKAYNLEKAAGTLSKGLGLMGLFTPINSLIKSSATGAAYSAEQYKEKKVKEYMNSDYYTDKNKVHELEYELTGDYDSYSDINYGPSYGNEYKEGTVFDAEDHGEPPSYTPEPVATPFHPSQGNNNNNSGRDPSQGNTQTGHGNSGMGRNPEDRM